MGTIVTIIIGVAVAVYMISMIVYYAYRKHKGKPISSCECSHTDIVKAYHKKYGKTCSNKDCSCHKD